MNLPEPAADDRALEARLRRDAATWGGDLDAAARARLHGLARPGFRHRRWAMVIGAAALVAATTWFCVRRGRTELVPPPVLPEVDICRLEAMALAPLRDELVAMLDDGRAVVHGVWRQLPPPLRRLVR